MDVTCYCCITTGAVKRSPSTTSATQKEVETSVAKWLTGARDRDGLRSNRLKGKSTAVPESVAVAARAGSSSCLLPMLGNSEQQRDEADDD